MKDKVIEVFNQLSTVYATTVDTKSFFNAEYERPAMLLELAQDLQGNDVLDAGCAAGWYSEILMQRGADVTAVDISKDMVVASKQRLGDKAKIFCLDIEKELPFQDNSFDLILSSLTLHYLKDWNLTFQEFKRVLKPDGYLLYSVHHPFSDTTLLGKEANYYSTELILDTWDKEGKKYEVPFYHRPLHSIINVTSRYLTIEKLVEPLPTEEFKALYPERFKHLLNNPQFLIVKAINNKVKL